MLSPKESPPIVEGDRVQVIKAPGMPRTQAWRIGQIGTVIDVCEVGGRLQYRVHFPSGSVDFLENEIQLFPKR